MLELYVLLVILCEFLCFMSLVSRSIIFKSHSCYNPFKKLARLHSSFSGEGRQGRAFIKASPRTRSNKPASFYVFFFAAEVVGGVLSAFGTART